MRFMSDTLLARWLLVLVVAVLVLVPFHATLTVWLASIFGHYTAFRLWKEALLAIAMLITAVLLFKNSTLRRKIWQDPFIRPILILIGIYVLLHLLMAGVALLRHDVTLKALGYGFASNLRFILFFVVCLVLGNYYGDWLKTHWKPILLLPAAIVVIFGLLQFFVLPVDFLKHLGYGPETIKSYIAVDQKIEYARTQSTLRGPNPLGAYMVLVIAALTALFVSKQARSWQILVAITASLIALYATYSRSAYLGVVLSVALLVWCMVRSTHVRKLLLAGAGIAVALGICALFMLRNHDTVQNVVFHTDEHSAAATSSNESRTGALQGGFENIKEQPLGRGPGTAGPASVYNDNDARVAENYFIQIAQEVGVFGSAIFIALCYLVGRTLWKIREWNTLPLVLLASLIGISFINVLSHAWADDTLAYIWWGLAGLTIGSALLMQEKKGTHGKKTV